jgi:hypothetical protein
MSKDGPSLGWFIPILGRGPCRIWGGGVGSVALPLPFLRPPCCFFCRNRFGFLAGFLDCFSRRKNAEPLHQSSALTQDYDFSACEPHRQSSNRHVACWKKLQIVQPRTAETARVILIARNSVANVDLSAALDACGLIPANVNLDIRLLCASYPINSGAHGNGLSGDPVVLKVFIISEKR